MHIFLYYNCIYFSYHTNLHGFQKWSGAMQFFFLFLRTMARTSPIIKKRNDRRINWYQRTFLYMLRIQVPDSHKATDTEWKGKSYHTLPPPTNAPTHYIYRKTLSWWLKDRICREIARRLRIKSIQILTSLNFSCFKASTTYWRISCNLVS